MRRGLHLLRLTLFGAATSIASTGLAAEPPDAGAASSTTRPQGAELLPAERVAEAEWLAEAAFEAYRLQQYQRAIQLYQAAWSAAPSADIAFNIARVYDRGLRDARSACEHYRRYVADPKALPERRRNAEQRIAELEAQLASTPPAVAPAAPLVLARAAAAGSAPATPPTRPLADGDRGWTPRNVTALILAGTGVTALGVGLGFALSAHSESSHWERDCDGNACTSQRAVNAARSAGRKADVATMALAAGGGLLAVGATLWWLGPDDGESAPLAELRLAPSGHAADLTCTLSGRF